MRVLKFSFFSLDKAEQKLFHLKRAFETAKNGAKSKEADNSHENETTLELYDSLFMFGLSSLEVSDNPRMVRAAGGLLHFLQENFLVLQCSSAQDVLPSITSLKHIELFDFFFKIIRLIKILNTFHYFFHSKKKINIKNWQ